MTSVSVAENDGRSWAERAQWSLADHERPITGLDSMRNRGLADITDGLLLADSSVLLAYGGRNVVELYGPGDSKPARVVQLADRSEIRYLGHLDEIAPDTLTAWDAAGRSQVVLTSAGTILETFVVPRAALPAMREEVAPLGRHGLVIKALDATTVANQPGSPVRSLVRILILHAPALTIDTMGTWPGAAHFLSREAGRRINTLFSPTTVIASGGDPPRIVIGDPARPEFFVHSAAGDTLRIVRWQVPPRLPTDEDIRAAIAVRQATLPPGDAVESELIAASANDPTAPFFDRVLLDRTSTWVRRYQLPTDSSASWLLFGEEGQLVAELWLPPDLIVLDIRDDQLLAVRKASAGRWLVTVHDIQKSR